MPAENVQRMNDNAPPPPARPRRGMFPKVYRNREGPRDNPTENFPAWQIRRGPEGTDRTTYEFPIKPLDQPMHLSSQFNFQRPPAPLWQCVIPPENGDDWFRPPNDPGPFRGVENRDGDLVGVIAHPEGNLRGYEAATLAPLSRQGRDERARATDRALTGRPTWPERGSRREW